MAGTSIDDLLKVINNPTANSWDKISALGFFQAETAGQTLAEMYVSLQQKSLQSQALTKLKDVLSLLTAPGNLDANGRVRVTTINAAGQEALDPNAAGLLAKLWSENNAAYADDPSKQIDGSKLWNNKEDYGKWDKIDLQKAKSFTYTVGGMDAFQKDSVQRVNEHLSTEISALTTMTNNESLVYKQKLEEQARGYEMKASTDKMFHDLLRMIMQMYRD